MSLYNPPLRAVVKFLKNLQKKGLSYGAVNSACSALSAILPRYDGLTAGNHPYVRLACRGSYNRNPPQPKYDVFWDVNKVFNMFKKWGYAHQLSLKDLTQNVSFDAFGLSPKGTNHVSFVVKFVRIC